MGYQSIVALLLAVVLPFAGCSKSNPADSRNQSAPAVSQQASGSEPPVYSFEVVRAYPHDPAAFTQGLIFAGGFLYESTGLNGASSLRKVDLTTGRVLQKADVPVQYFAEGLTLFRGKLFQLTWQAHKGFIYDQGTFAMEKEFPYDVEGWGLTHDDQFLIMSDGSNQLRFIDPADFQVKKTISVMDKGRPLFALNELEYIKGEIYSNIWHDDRIVRIDPASGKILAWINLAGLLSAQERGGPENVLNGIAYDDVEDRLFVTGKRWPKLFEIRLKEQS
jgi:glutaminyl-peptide cyclotransferase